MSDRKNRSGIGSESVLQELRAEISSEQAALPLRRHASTVLVVDDEPAGRYATSRMLQVAGYVTLETGSGVDAVHMAGKADAVVLDVNLPDLNGVQVCSALRSQPRGRALPIVMHSAVYADELHRDAGLAAGANAYLFGPARQEQLLTVLDDLLRPGAQPA